jgi:hypothetical protein
MTRPSLFHALIYPGGGLFPARLFRFALSDETDGASLDFRDERDRARVPVRRRSARRRGETAAVLQAAAGVENYLSQLSQKLARYRRNIFLSFFC